MLSNVQTSRATRSSGPGLQNDVGEIRSLEQPMPVEAISGGELYPGEAAASLVQPSSAMDSGITALTSFLGTLLTVANPAWMGDPIPKMRGLQRRLIEHSLNQEEGRRHTCLAAISVVENAVQLRLRFQQMRMTDAEMQPEPTRGEAA